MEEPAPPAHNVVLIVIDAGRPSYLNLLSAPHIDALMRHGTVYDRAYVGEMESSTPGVHVTLGTGTLPRENGFLGFGWAVPNTRRIVDFRTLLADGQIDPVLRALPVPSVARRLHQFFPRAIAIAGSGHKDYAAVGLGGAAADYVLYGHFGKTQFTPTFMPGHGAPALSPAERASLTLKLPLAAGAEDSFAFRYASIVASHVRPRLLMINLPEMDTRGHWNGPDYHAIFRLLLRNIDRGIGELESTYRRLGILGNTDFIITADHAMMESRAAHNWGNVQATIRAAGVPVVRADGAGGAIWLRDPRQAKLAADHLAASHPQHVQAIFYRSGPGADFQYVQASPMSWLVSTYAGAALKRLVDTSAGVNGPDLWVLYRENYTTVPLNVAGKWRGTHGGATWKVQHIPLIISGPGVRQGVHSQFPGRAMDIAPTMERLLGLPFIKRDGVVLADAFTKTLPGEMAPERALATELGAEVQALQEQSTADDRAIHWPGSLPRPFNPCGTPQKPTCKLQDVPPTNQ